MAADQTASTGAPQGKTKLDANALAVKRAAHRKARRAGDKKRTLKLASDKEFAKTFFEGRSKRAIEKKQAFRKKKSKKK
jgi:hypothetical protein